MNIKELKKLEKGTMLRHKSTGCVLPFDGVVAKQVVLKLPFLCSALHTVEKSSLVAWPAEECELAAAIPVSEAKHIADKYGYDQVVIMAKKAHATKSDWEDGWNSTYNTDKAKCKFLGKVAAVLHHNFRCFYDDEATVEDYLRRVKELVEE